MSRFIGIFIGTLVQIMSTLVLIYCIVSWIVPPQNRYRILLDQFMNTFLNPIRKFMPRTGMFDFSPIILLLLLQFLEMIVRAVF